MEKYIIFEVGANNGADTYRFVDKENSYVYAFEPLPFLCDTIKERLKGYDNLEVFNMAISDYDGSSKFGISDPTKGAMDYGCSSLFSFTDNIEELWPNRGDFNFIEYIDVDVMRMDTFITKNNIERIDFLHCDAQGGDLKVLQSFGDKLSILQSGVVEAASRVNLYNVDNSGQSIVEFLEQNNFNVTNKHDVGSASEEIDIYFERL